MKREKRILAFVLSAILMCSCSSKIDGYENYKDACNNGRFDVALKFIEQMEEYEQYDPLKYVFAKEAELITENLNRESINDLKNLFNRYKKIGYNQMDKLCETLIKQTIAKNNIALCEELMALHRDEDYPDDITIAILNMYKENNTGKFRNFAMSNINKYEIESYIIEYLRENDDRELLKALTSKYQDNIFKNENILSLYEEKYPAELKEQITKELFKLKKQVPTRPAIGMVKSDRYGDIPQEYLNYTSQVQSYNAQCTKLLAYAYNMNDKKLANFIVSNMCSSLTYQVLGNWSKIAENNPDSHSVYEAYMVKINNDDIEEAKQQIKEYFNVSI